MRWVSLCLILAGCHPPATPFVAGAAATVVSVATFGRSPVDLVYSLATGRDCSIVRLDRGERYCKPVAPQPAQPPFCTRTLGVAECFNDPETLSDNPAPLADGPATLSKAQEADRTAKFGL
jgi:hypothetical protein